MSRKSQYSIFNQFKQMITKSSSIRKIASNAPQHGFCLFINVIKHVDCVIYKLDEDFVQRSLPNFILFILNSTLMSLTNFHNLDGSSDELKVSKLLCCFIAPTMIITIVSN
jgi:hypothetical protein